MGWFKMALFDLGGKVLNPAITKKTYDLIKKSPAGPIIKLAEKIDDKTSKAIVDKVVKTIDTLANIKNITDKTIEIELDKLVNKKVIPAILKDLALHPDKTIKAEVKKVLSENKNQ